LAILGYGPRKSIPIRVCLYQPLAQVVFIANYRMSQQLWVRSFLISCQT
jgi:hypothetical protein